MATAHNLGGLCEFIESSLFTYRKGQITVVILLATKVGGGSTSMEFCLFLQSDNGHESCYAAYTQAEHSQGCFLSVRQS